MKAALTILLLLISKSLFAGSSKIVPENKAQLIRQVGEAVYVACKKAGPYSTNCQVDCGNGRRFSKASGYCYFMRQGTFLLKVSTRYRNRNILHTATVIVKDEIAGSPTTKTQLSSVNSLGRQKTVNDQLNAKTLSTPQNMQSNEQFTQNLQNEENMRRVAIQNELNQVGIQDNNADFGRDSLPPGGDFSGNDATNIADQNANRVVLR